MFQALVIIKPNPVTKLAELNIYTSKNSGKQNTWDPNYPLVEQQFGAIYYGVNENKVIKLNAVAYIEFRFFRSHLKN